MGRIIKKMLELETGAAQKLYREMYSANVRKRTV
jgi:hypothetical protein